MQIITGYKNPDTVHGCDSESCNPDWATNDCIPTDDTGDFCNTGSYSCKADEDRTCFDVWGTCGLCSDGACGSRTVTCIPDKPCVCSLWRDDVNIYNNSNGILNVGGECQVSCYDGNVLKDECKEQGDYRVEFDCRGNEDYSCALDGADFCTTGAECEVVVDGTSVVERSVIELDYDPTAVDGTCNEETTGIVSPGIEKICAYDPKSDSYEWFDAETDQFKILDIFYNNMNIISNSDQWYYCNAGGSAECTITKYECSLNQEIYGGQGSCESACSEEAACTSPTYYKVKTSSKCVTWGWTKTCTSGECEWSATTTDSPPEEGIKIGEGRIPGSLCTFLTYNNQYYDFYETCQDQSYSCEPVESSCSDALSSITQIDNYGTFEAVGSASPYVNIDGDNCSAAEEFPDYNDRNPNIPEDQSWCNGPIDMSGGTGPGGSSSFIDGANCQNKNIDDCLGPLGEPGGGGEPGGPGEEENETINFEDIPDISSSFICYNDNNNNYIAQCCTFGNCYNEFRVDNKGSLTYDRAYRAFGNAGALKTIDAAGDRWDGFKVVDRISQGTIYGFEIRDGMSLEGNDMLSFDIAFNYGDNIKIKLMDDSLNTIGREAFIGQYAVNHFTTYRWHRIKIPIQEAFGGITNQLNRVKNIDIFIEDAKLDQEFLVDDFYLSNESDRFPDVYCSAYFGAWVDELDPEESDPEVRIDYTDDVYKWACKGVPSFGWTGTQCCGDDSTPSDAEYFTDTQAGCWGGYAVDDESTADYAINDETLYDLLYTSNSFHLCNFDGANPGHGQEDIVQSQNACAVPGNIYFCDYDYSWNDEPAYGYYDWEKFDSGTRSVPQSISTDSPDMTNYTEIASAESCCPLDFCWDGNRCIDGRINKSETGVDYIPESYVYLVDGESDTDDFGVVCSQGSWNSTEKKYSPHQDYSGYCWFDSQCYYEDGSGDKECFDSGEFVSFGDEYTDYVCDNGDWTSRTKMLAEAMMDIGDKANKPFSLFCDDAIRDNTLNMEFKDYNNNEFNPFSEFAVDTRETSGSLPGGEHIACILIIDSNNNGRFGDPVDPEDLIILGAPMAQAWEDSSGFYTDAIDCNNNYPEIIEEGNEYLECENNLWYNPTTKTIIFSEQEFNVPCSQASCSTLQNFFSAIGNWISSFLGMKTDAEWTDVTDALEHADSSLFFHSNVLYNHVYYYTDGTKKIVAVKDFKDMLKTSDYQQYKYALFTEYTGFDIGLCNVYTVDDTTQYITPRGVSQNSKITCSADNTTIIELLDPNEEGDNYWPDMTGRLRPR